jgi:hypothetical protein
MNARSKTIRHAARALALALASARLSIAAGLSLFRGEFRAEKTLRGRREPVLDQLREAAR